MYNILVEVTTWYLEMLDPKQLRSSAPGDYQLRIEQAKIPSPEFSHFLYSSVGGKYYWIDRLSWNKERWHNYPNRPELETWVAYISGTPAGYIELEMQPQENAEVAYFGILPQFIGQRLGGHLLSVGVKRAWEIGAKRVWVHTCSLDSPHALANYQARGFQIYKQEVRTQQLPNRPISPWLGAYASKIL
ncbi:acetyltransferase [Nostoc minutum NIES-26]|uniref:Acetyltransferase n=1 Tax=Nostoc minutum NIES-26 TaxID=1844469 RepID=A0A367R7P1_9NOSO|nr:acetyltransferase [Nostoc minutum NIES-26]